MGWPKEKQDEVLETERCLRKKDLNLDGKLPYLESDSNDDETYSGEDETSCDDEI